LGVCFRSNSVEKVACTNGVGLIHSLSR
jgi:hypothetical protein